jgi:iron complex outermembrane receptor protein
MNRSGSIGLLLLLAPTSAWADDNAPPEPTEVGSETIIVIDRALDRDADPAAHGRDRSLGDAPFVTVVRADDHPATASVADAIGATVGTQLRSLGGLGAYQSITVRGAAPGHTLVLVDGVPLARLAAVTTDLGRFTLDAFGEIELYRGAVPIELGGAGVGGALNLVTRMGRGEHGERARASIGAGSFGARHVHLHYGDSYRGGALVSAASVGYQGASGDYSYFWDNGTPLNLKDDSYETRRNNGFSQLDASARLGRTDRSAVGGIRLLGKQQGLPGGATQPSFRSSLSTIDVLADGRFDASVGTSRARQLGYVLVEHQSLRDPDGELGLGTQDRTYVTLSGGAQSAWSVPLGRHELVLGGEMRGDRFHDADDDGNRAPLRGQREGVALLAGLDLVVDPLATIIVTPGLRWDGVHTSPAPNGTGPGGLEPLPPRWEQAPSPRLSARAAIVDDVAIKTSVGRYLRLPTLVELFGNRGTIIGSPELRPETGGSAELGVVWAPARALGAVDRVMVEANTFGTRSHDTIAFVSSIGFVAQAMNVSASQTYGGEVVASARLARMVSLTANYTRLVTQQLTQDMSYANKALPRQPAHALYGRIDATRVLHRRRGSIWIDASWQARTFLDRANRAIVPSRTLVGGGVRVELLARLNASFTVQNLLDLRVQEIPLDPAPRPDLTMTPTALADVAGFPLPGRTLYLTLDWSY